MSLYANINVAKAQEKVHPVRGPQKKPSKSAALYADVQARPPPQEETAPRAAPAPSSDVVDLVEDASEKNTEALGTFFNLVRTHSSIAIQAYDKTDTETRQRESSPSEDRSSRRSSAISIQIFPAGRLQTSGRHRK